MGVAFLPGLASPTHAATGATYLDQGTLWTPADRADFYTRDQGSRLIPARWLGALKQADGTAFLADGLSRYGYLPMDTTSTSGLPVGFTLSGDGDERVVGLTCSACHTRQIDVNGVPIRIDGGPTFADFQTFLLDLDAAMGAVVNGPPKVFADFAAVVLGPGASKAETDNLKAAVRTWFAPFDAIVKGALTQSAWGPGRLDAVGMIINRLAGLDIGTSPDRIIASNIRPATAPARYPFLWNATLQDKTQWPGIADNGSDLLGLARNVGEVIGVFARFQPKKSLLHILGVDYTKNSVNFDGLEKVENLVKKIGPPKWIWGVKTELLPRGEEVYRLTAMGPKGGCISCHALRPVPEGETHSGQKTWLTPLKDVGTDSRQWRIMTWDVDTGVLNGARIPFLADKLKPRDLGVNVLRTAVVGVIAQHKVPVILAPPPPGSPLPGNATTSAFEKETDNTDLKGVFKAPEPSSTYVYEARVLEGIWAAAPYLHNGAVPTLSELLKPDGQRAPNFKVGPAYDVNAVGLAAEQPNAKYTLQTTDKNERDSGNCRCGHNYGTELPDPDKAALLEFLKTL